MRLQRIEANEVVVPARDGAINSAALDRPLHKLEREGNPAWTRQFDAVPKLILVMRWDDGTVGYGECYRDHDWRIVSDMSHALLGVEHRSLSLQDLPLEKCRERDGFECAIYDSVAKAHGLRIVDLLGGPVRDRVKVGAWSGHRTLEEVPALAARFAALGYDCIKFKCDLGDDVVGWCREVRGAAPGMRVILDPNERWESEASAAERLEELAEVGNVLCVEDPIPRSQLDGYRRLREAFGVKIALHVSLPYLEHGQHVRDALDAVTAHAIDGFNFNGNVTEFAQLDSIAAAAGMPSWHGSELDLGVLEALYVHSAAAARSVVWPSDIFGRLIREHDLLSTPLRIEPPYAYLPGGLGLGVEPDGEALERFTTRVEVYEA